MANTYNPELASRVSAAQSKQFVDYGKSFSEGFTPGLNKAVASKVAKEKAAAEAAKKAAAEDAKQKEEGKKQAEKILEDGLKSFDISDDGYLKSWKSGAKNMADSYRLDYVNTIKEETKAGPLDLNQKMQFITDRNDLITKPTKLKQTLLRDTQVLGVLVEDFKDGSFSPVNPPELKIKAAAILNTSKPIGEGLYEYELNGKKEKIDSQGLEDLVREFNYTATADYENLFDEADKIAASTKVTKDGKVGYDFNQGKQLLLKGKIEQRLNDKDTGDDFLFDSLSNSKLKTGPIQDQTYKDKTKPEIIEMAKSKFGASTDEEAIDKLKQFVSNSYVDLFKNAFPPLQQTSGNDKVQDEKNVVKQAKTFLSKAKNDVRWEGVTNPSSTLFKNFGGPEFESKITEYGLTAEPISDAKSGELIGWRVYNPASGFKNYSQDLMFNETLPNIDRKLMVAIGANHPDVFELPVIKQ